MRTIPATWGTRSAAEARASNLPKPFRTGGIGIELGDLGDGRCLAGIDLDSCRQGQEIVGWALEVIQAFNSYTEISPSGGGAMIFFLIAADGVRKLQPLLG